MKAFFNSSAFRFNGFSVKHKGSRPLTNKIAGAINGAKRSLQIATTRITTKPIARAIKRAARRGVKIQIAVNMDQFRARSGRRSSLPYQLAQLNNVELRIKFYNLAYHKKFKDDLPTYITNQMHSKYVIVDGRQDQRRRT